MKIRRKVDKADACEKGFQQDWEALDIKQEKKNEEMIAQRSQKIKEAIGPIMALCMNNPAGGIALPALKRDKRVASFVKREKLSDEDVVAALGGIKRKNIWFIGV